jgi:hypothetical protein
MAMSETELQKQIIYALRSSGYWAFRVNSGRSRGAGGMVQGAPPGTPDICLVNPAGWLEVKLAGEKLKPSQLEWHERARKAGVRVATVCTIGEALIFAGDWTRQDSMRVGLALRLKSIAEEVL